MTGNATVRKVLLAFALLCVPAAPVAGADAPGESAAGVSVLEVRFEAGLLTLTAENVTLGEVMQRIGREAGVRVYLPDEIARERGSWSAEALPLPEALSRIVRPHSMLVMHEPPAAGAAAELRVSEVHVLPSGGAAPVRAAPPALLRPAAPAQSAAAAAAVQAAGVAGDAAGQDDSAQWANTLTRDADATNRRLAVAELERLGSDRAVRALERGIGDRDAEVRIEVIQALGRLGAESSVAVIGRAAIGDRDPRVREEALRVLDSDPRESAKIFLRQASRATAGPPPAPAAPAAARTAPAGAAAGSSAIAPASRAAQPAPALISEPVDEKR